MQEEMFTDYAMQIISAYMTRDDRVIATLMDSYSDDEWSNPAFLPGVMHALVVHFQMAMYSIANMTDTDVEKVFSEYAKAYTLNRPQIAKQFVSPSEASKIATQWLADYEKNEGESQKEIN